MAKSAAGAELIEALLDGDTDRARVLIAGGADLTVRDEDYGATALHACEDVELCKVLLDAGMEVDVLSEVGAAPLYWAAARVNGAAKVRLLLDAGADVKRPSSDGQTALHSAASQGRLDSAALLIAAGAEVDAESTGGNYPGSTPLLSAAEKGHQEMVALLLEHGANLEAADRGQWPECGRTALHFAVECGGIEFVRWILEQGADVGAERRDGRTVFDVAEDNEELSELLEQY